MTVYEIKFLHVFAKNYIDALKIYIYLLSSMKNPTTLTMTKLAKHIGVSLRTMYHMIDDGRFPVKPIRNSKPRRWNTDLVNKWLLNG